MKRKNLLLVVFFLSLFVSQQVQAGATTPVQTQINPSPANSVLSSQFQIYIYYLTNSRAITPDHKLCAYPRDFGVYGCGSEFPDKDILDPAGFYYIGEQYYLQNVLPNEMNFAQIPPEAEALKAQAVASRTVGSWKAANGPWDDGKGKLDGVWPRINNSTTYQVFIPGTYTKSSYQSDIDMALTTTQYQYLQYLIGNNHAIDAEFFADVASKTTDGDLASAPYLKGVDDPISTSCIVSVSGQHTYGMSQRGAIRWAIGNQCPNGGGTAWPVKWNYQQILAHYYTGVNFVNDNTGVEVAPDNRWNLLNYTTPNGTTANAGSNFSVTLTLQNTSNSDWTSGVTIGYKWTTQDAWQDIPNAPVLNLAKGITSDPTINISVPVPASLTSGTYTLYLDLRNQNGATSWFSEQSLPWPYAGINNVQVTNTSGQQTIGISISQGSDDGGTNPTPCTFSATDNEVYLGACFSSGDITSGFRFNNVQIPTGAHIDNAYITFTVDGPYSVPVNVRIYGDNIANSDTFSDTNTPVDRSPTSHSVLWNIPSTDVWNLGETRNTPNFSQVIQDIVSSGTGWNAGNSLSIIFANNGSTNVRRVIAFERASWDPSLHAAQLFVTYDHSAPTPTSTPLPTSTPIPPTPVPTIAPTIAPTPVPQPTDSMCWCFIWWWFGNCGQTSAQQSFTVAFHSVNHAAADINLFYSVRDEILAKTSEGQRFINLYDTYSPELIQIAKGDPNVKAEAGAMIDLWSPSLQALVDGKGDQVIITAEQISATEKFVGDISVDASSEFKQAIADTLARHPMNPLVGMTMDQAWANLNGYQLSWLPPLTTANPYIAQTGSTIPIEFTLTDLKGNFAVDNSVTLKILDANGNVVSGPFGINSNPTQGVTVQGKKYHYDFQTTGLATGLYTIQVSYNSTNGQFATYAIQLSSKK